MSERYTNPTPQYLDQNGNPVPGGLLNFFDTGTSTRKDTFSDAALTTANANPVVLDSTGRAPDIFYSGTAKVTLQTAEEVQIWERDPVGGTFAQQANDWVSSTVYSQNDIVQGSDTLYYKSRTDLNQGNDPISATANWSKLEWQTALTNAEMLTHDLTGVDRVSTTGDAADGDGGGHEWTATGGTGTAGTTDYPNRVLFDLEGNEFQEVFNRYVWHDEYRVSSSEFVAVSGSPAQGIVNSAYPAMLFDDSLTEQAGVSIPPPYLWNAGECPSVKIFFTTVSANTSDDVVLRVLLGTGEAGTVLGAEEQVNTFTVPVEDIAFTIQEVTATFSAALPFPRTTDVLGGGLFLRIERIGGNGSDTAAGDFALLGAKIVYTSDGPTAGDP